MRLTVMAGDDRFLEVEVDPTEVVEGVKALVEVETGVPVSSQELLFEGRPLADHSALSASGIKEGDMLVMVSQAVRAAGAQGGAAGAADPMALAGDGAAVNPEAFRAAVIADRPLLARLSQVNPSLARAIETNNMEEMQHMLRRQRELVKAEQRKQQEDEELLMADPFDPAAQAKIEERIRQANIDLNYEVALEHNPEQFVAVHMLYVDMKVNKHPIKAFVDSGAQTTIMSLAMAERCDLMRLVDKRFHGTAVGVGTSKIVGIIHAVPLQIGPNFYSCRISVLENLGTDFLFGLDMLRRHQCCIDLKANALIVGGGEISVPFLAEKDCPKKDESELERLAQTTDKDPADQAGSSAPGPSSAAQGVSAPGAASSARGAGGLESAAGGHEPGQGAQTLAPPAAGAAGSMEGKVAKLVELGFTRQQAQEALLVTNGNEEQAAGLLFQGM